VKRAAAALLTALLASSCAAFAADATAQEPADRAVLELGARVGPQWVYLEGDFGESDLRGYFAGVDGTLRVTRRLGIGGVVEASVYDGRSDRLEPGPSATSYAAFAELRVETNPEGPFSFRIDMGPGTRWLILPMTTGPAETYGALEPLRLRVGPAYRAGALELSVAIGLGFGWFMARPADRSCAVTGSCEDSLVDSDTASSVHFVNDLSVSVRGWP